MTKTTFPPSLHPAANKQKMGTGTPLNDEDRHPWLAQIGKTLKSGASNGDGVIIACSALKRRYRDQLRAEAGDVLFLHLSGDAEILGNRVADRQHEFMPAAMHASQLAALEPLDADEQHVLLDIRESPATPVEQARQALMDDGALGAAQSLA